MNDVPHEANRVQDARAAIHQIADEQGLASLRVGESAVAPDRIILTQQGRRIAEPLQQLLKFVAAAVDIADDIEWAMLSRLVVP